MEHRCNIRRAVGVVSTLRVPGVGLVAARLRNASIGGVFVELPRGRLPRFCHVELELAVPEFPLWKSFRCPAMVIRVQPDGVALMFDDLRPVGIIRLFNWLDAPVACGPEAGETMPGGQITPPLTKSRRKQPVSRHPS